MKFFEELKKRNVYKAGAAYVVTGWLLLQIVDVVGPGFGWPESLTALITKILLVGFPIALVLAWLYELTPKGFKRTGTYQEDTEDNKKAGRRLNYFIIGILSVAVCFLLVDKVFISGGNNTDDRQEASIANLPEFTSSIAVLAFDDMSPNKDQEYLSDGISEEILNYLAKYKDLKVISRTSSFAYKGKDVTIDVIGEELGVAYVLEGSVRKAGDTYRITVQLIDTKDGAHIWSDTFDRKIEDVLFVQDEIAGIVANRLNLTLSNEDVRLRKVDPEAYDSYLQAWGVLKIFNDSTTSIADSLIRKSLEIDSGYSPAWSALSMTTLHTGIYYKHLTEREALTIGMDAAKKAIEIDSNNVTAHNWLSNWQWHAREGEISLKTLEKILEKHPNLYEPISYAKHAYTRLGMPEKGLEYAYKAIQFSPKEHENYYWAWSLERYLGNYDRASEMYFKYIDVQKKETGVEPYYDETAMVYYEIGESDRAQEFLGKETDPYWKLATQITIAYKEGNRKEANELFESLRNLPIEQIKESTEDQSLSIHHYNLAILYSLQGDSDKAFIALDMAYPRLLTHTEDLWRTPAFKNLLDDTRWNELLERLSKEFNYDYTTP
jgi:TolB-like protein/Tfp pilus assembly protein PilF